MSIDYSKAEDIQPRYFLLFGTEGVWQEVTEKSYVAAEKSQGLGSSPVADFTSETLRGTVTHDGSRPKDVEAEKVVEPMVRRASEDKDASYRLIFPEGSYSTANVGQDSGPDFGMVTLILSPEQYKRFCKAQTPINLDALAARLEKLAEGANPLKETVLEGIASGLHQAADEMREGKAPKKPQRPSLQDLRDLLKG